MDEIVIIDGINKSLDNAKQLIEEANLLKKYNKCERSYLLFQISIEETGKTWMLFDFLLQEDFKNTSKHKEFFTNFKNHPFKTKTAIGVNLMIADLIKDRELYIDYIKFIKNQYDNLKIYDRLKNLSLYTSFEDSKFHLPTSFIDEEILNQIKIFAETISLVSNTIIPVLIKDLAVFRPQYQDAIKSLK